MKHLLLGWWVLLAVSTWAIDTPIAHGILTSPLNANGQPLTNVARVVFADGTTQATAGGVGGAPTNLAVAGVTGWTVAATTGVDTNRVLITGAGTAEANGTYYYYGHSTPSAWGNLIEAFTWTNGVNGLAVYTGSGVDWYLGPSIYLQSWYYISSGGMGGTWNVNGSGPASAPLPVIAYAALIDTVTNTGLLALGTAAFLDAASIGSIPNVAADSDHVVNVTLPSNGYNGVPMQTGFILEKSDGTPLVTLAREYTAGGGTVGNIWMWVDPHGGERYAACMRVFGGNYPYGTPNNMMSEPRTVILKGFSVSSQSSDGGAFLLEVRGAPSGREVAPYHGSLGVWCNPFFSDAWGKTFIGNLGDHVDDPAYLDDPIYHPHAWLQLRGQSTLTPALLLESGSPVTQVQPGALENDGAHLYYTDAGSNRWALLVASNLNTLNATSIVAGAVGDDHLSTNVAMYSGTNVFGGTNRFAGVALLTNIANVLGGNGNALSNLNATNLSGWISSTNLAATLRALATNNGVALTNLDPSIAFNGQTNATFANRNLTTAYTRLADGVPINLISTNGQLGLGAMPNGAYSLTVTAAGGGNGSVKVAGAVDLGTLLTAPAMVAGLNGSLGWSNGPLLRNTNNALTVTATNTTYSGLTTATNGAVSGRTATWTTAELGPAQHATWLSNGVDIWYSINLSGAITNRKATLTP